jgi:hypothetical protein
MILAFQQPLRKFGPSRNKTKVSDLMFRLANRTLLLPSTQRIYFVPPPIPIYSWPVERRGFSLSVLRGLMRIGIFANELLSSAGLKPRFLVSLLRVPLLAQRLGKQGMVVWRLRSDL